MNDARPKFLSSYLELVRRESEQTGWRAVIPYVLILVSGACAFVAYFVPVSFWSDENWQVSTAVYGGLLTFNGLVLALGWNAFSRMYDILLRGEFGRYLAQRDLLNGYLAHIGFMHLVHVLAVIASGIGLVAVLLNISPLAIDRVILGITLTLTAYSLKQAVDAVSAMHDLVWQGAFFELSKPDQNVRPLKSAAEK